MFVGKQASVCRCSKGCASALSGSGSRTLFPESYLLCVLQVYFVRPQVEPVVSEIDIIVSSTCNCNLISCECFLPKHRTV